MGRKVLSSLIFPEHLTSRKLCGVFWECSWFRCLVLFFLSSLTSEIILHISRCAYLPRCVWVFFCSFFFFGSICQEKCKKAGHIRPLSCSIHKYRNKILISYRTYDFSICSCPHFLPLFVWKLSIFDLNFLHIILCHLLCGA